MKKFKIIPIFVPHKGCPHQCSFCNQRHITGQINDVTPAMARDTIEKYLSTIDSGKYRIDVAFYGGSFTAIDIEIQNQLLDVALEYKIQGRINGIRLSTRPDCIDALILENLKNKGVTEIELGVQSMCNEVLEFNNRGHNSDHVIQAVCLIRKFGFNLGLQMMVGLVGDTKEKDIYTARQIALLQPDFVRIYPTLVFKNTEMYEKYLKGEFTPLTVEQAIDICVPIVEIFNSHKINVIRLGLLMSDDEAKNNYVEGPYHPRFRELVEEKLLN